MIDFKGVWWICMRYSQYFMNKINSYGIFIWWWDSIISSSLLAVSSSYFWKQLRNKPHISLIRCLRNSYIHVRKYVGSSPWYPMNGLNDQMIHYKASDLQTPKISHHHHGQPVPPLPPYRANYTPWFCDHHILCKDTLS